MKTSVEMQLKILEKMSKNIKIGEDVFNGIEYYSGEWISNKSLCADDFAEYEFRVKPQTITINGIEITKPLGGHEIIDDVFYYFVDNSHSLHNQKNGIYIKNFGIRFVYRTKEEAIEASKLLFGLKD